MTAIILAWNRPDLLRDCLSSLGAQDYPNCSVLIVDNGSGDGLPDIVRSRCPQVDVVTNSSNLGYAGGNNKGIQCALRRPFDYVWLLNEDVVVSSDALSSLVACAALFPLSGFFGPKVYMREDPKRLLTAGGTLKRGVEPTLRGLGQMDVGQFDMIEKVDFVSGCALLVRRSAIESVGLLDERFFLYHEDIDWCFRGKRLGFTTIFVPEAKVWHPDTRNRDENAADVTYYIARNSLLFVAKHGLGKKVFGRLLLTYTRTLLSWSFRPKWRGKRELRNALLQSIVDYLSGRTGERRVVVRSVPKGRDAATIKNTSPTGG